MSNKIQSPTAGKLSPGSQPISDDGANGTTSVLVSPVQTGSVSLFSSSQDTQGELMKHIKKINGGKYFCGLLRDMSNLFCKLYEEDAATAENIFKDDEMSYDCLFGILMTFCAKKQEENFLHFFNMAYVSHKSEALKFLQMLSEEKGYIIAKIIGEIEKSDNGFQNVVDVLLSKEIDAHCVHRILNNEMIEAEKSERYLKEIYRVNRRKIISLLNFLVRSDMSQKAAEILLKVEDNKFEGIVNVLLDDEMRYETVSGILGDEKSAISESAVKCLIEIYSRNEEKASQAICHMCEVDNKNAVCLLAKMVMNGDSSCNDVVKCILQIKGRDTIGIMLARQTITSEEAERLFDLMYSLEDKSKALEIFETMVLFQPKNAINVLLKKEKTTVENILLNSSRSTINDIFRRIEMEGKSTEEAVNLFKIIYEKDKKMASGAISNMSFAMRDDGILEAIIVEIEKDKDNYDIVQILTNENMESNKIGNFFGKIEKVNGFFENAKEIFKNLCTRSNDKEILLAISSMIRSQSALAMSSLLEMLENDESMEIILSNVYIDSDDIGKIFVQMAGTDESSDIFKRVETIFWKVMHNEKNTKERAMGILNSMCLAESKLAISILLKKLGNKNDAKSNDSIQSILTDENMKAASIGKVLTKMAETDETFQSAVEIFEIMYTKCNRGKAVESLNSMCLTESKLPVEILLGKLKNESDGGDIRAILLNENMKAANIGKVLTKMAETKETFQSAVEIFKIIRNGNAEKANAVINEMCKNFHANEEITAATSILLEMLKRNDDALVRIMNSKEMTPEAVVNILTHGSVRRSDAAKILILMVDKFNRNLDAKRNWSFAFTFASYMDNESTAKEIALLLEQMISLDQKDLPIIVDILGQYCSEKFLRKIFTTSGAMELKNIAMICNAMCNRKTRYAAKRRQNCSWSSKVAFVISRSKSPAQILAQDAITPKNVGKILRKIDIKDDLGAIVNEMIELWGGLEKVAKFLKKMKPTQRDAILKYCDSSCRDFILTEMKKLKSEETTQMPEIEETILAPKIEETTQMPENTSTIDVDVAQVHGNNILKSEEESRKSDGIGKQNQKINKSKAPFLKWVREIFTGTLNRVLILLAVTVVCTIIAGAIIGYPLVLCIGIGAAIIEAGAIGLLHRHRNQANKENFDQANISTIDYA
ncbi:MAG: hypothetical protein LBI69_03330 [Puniceicoccales bacterium]|jgi:lipopolysaccharide biosynthesis regulator YciM|nr:hypothetical protein [Puniceicoccales bacterium]